MIIVFILLTIAVVLVDKKHLDYLILVLVCYLAAFFYLLINSLFYFGAAFGKNVQYASSLRAIGKFNHCVDQYSQVNADVILWDYHAWYDAMIGVIFWLMVIAVILLGLVSGAFVYWLAR